MNNNTTNELNENNIKRTYRIKEASELLSLSESTVRRLINKGRIKVIPGIRHKIIPASEIDKLLNV